MKQIALEDIEATEDRARLWDTVFNLRLTILPPVNDEDSWCARTNGGTLDELKLHGLGRTPEEAVRSLTEQERFEPRSLESGGVMVRPQVPKDAVSLVVTMESSTDRKPARKATRKSAKRTKRTKRTKRVEVDPLS